MKVLFSIIIFIACITPVKLFAQNNSNEIIGYYYYFEPKEEEHSQVEIYKSGDKYKGKVIWLQNPNGSNGKPKTDKFNSDRSLRNREIIGITIFEGLEYNKKKNRWEGSIYDPANGDSFKCVIWFDSKDLLHIKGYVGSEWMGLSRIIIWSKEKEPRK